MRWNFDEDIQREGTDSLKYDFTKEVFGTRDIIPMWIADMDFRTPEFIINALRERLNHEIMGYSFRPPEFYRSIKSWFGRRHGWIIEEDWICFSPGIVPALNLCTLAFTRPGDSVVIQPPVYTPFFGAVESHGRNLILNPLIENNGKWTMDLEGLEKNLTPEVKMVIISNPHNPVGRAWSADELRELGELCVRKNILILSDEIHCDLILPGYKHTPMAALSEKIAEITVTCTAPSKTFNLAGLSTSSLIISNPVLRKYFNSKIGRLHLGNGNIFGTAASVAAYTSGDEWLDALLGYIGENSKHVTEYFAKSVPEIIPVKPEATYMIWLDCRKLGMSAAELQEFFTFKAGVGLNEGSSFGQGGEGFMRMNLGTTRKIIAKALEQISGAVSQLRTKNHTEA